MSEPRLFSARARGGGASKTHQVQVDSHAGPETLALCGATSKRGWVLMPGWGTVCDRCEKLAVDLTSGATL